MKGQFDGDWDYLAKELGYDSKRDLFEDLYTERGLSISQIAQRLGTGTFTISRHLALLGIVKRTRGGKNNVGKQAYKLFHLDQRLVISGDIDLIASKAGVSRSLLYKYRITRRRKVDGILHSSPDSGPGEILNSVTEASSAASSAERTLQGILQRKGEVR